MIRDGAPVTIAVNTINYLPSRVTCLLSIFVQGDAGERGSPGTAGVVGAVGQSGPSGDRGESGLAGDEVRPNTTSKEAAWPSC